MSSNGNSSAFQNISGERIEDYIDIITPEAFVSSSSVEEVEMPDDNMDSSINAAMDDFLNRVQGGQKLRILSDVTIRPERKPGMLETILTNARTNDTTTMTTEPRPGPSKSPVRSPSPVIGNKQRRRRMTSTRQRRQQQQQQQQEQQQQLSVQNAGLDDFSQDQHKNIVLEYRRLREELEMGVSECDLELMELQRQMDEVQQRMGEVRAKRNKLRVKLDNM